ncbi:MAG: hypothetical protein FJY82_08100 [Candidatus Aminicenantes bacterium]|nr:hypothetical protein [Candidatus Aminicenantes bacterium]
MKNFLAACAAGALFAAIFAFAYGRIPAPLYENRDDALITLSHARNLAEHGTIGVNPSGERVEGFSSPAQFLVFLPLYLLFGLSYGVFFKVQTFACAFLLGFFISKFFKPSAAAGLAASAALAVLLARNAAFLEWHGSGIENALAAPFIFGPSALDIVRTTTYAAPLSLLLCGLAIFHLPRLSWRLGAAGAVFALAIIGGGRNAAPYYLPWNTEDFRSWKADFLSLAEEHDLFRPAVANADLGLMSWSKEFNVVDLGRLGSPVLSRLPSGGNDRRAADYFFELAAPDFVEIHDNWACRWAALFADPRFRELYEPVREERTEWLERHCPATKAMTGLWVRRDIGKGSSSRERRLVDDLRRGPSAERVRAELESLGSGDGRAPAFYVVRAVYRFLPEFAARGEIGPLRRLFDKTPEAGYALAVLDCRTRAGWFKRVLSFLEKYAQRKANAEWAAAGRVEIRDIGVKSGFYDDGIWTRGRAAIAGVAWPVGREARCLVLEAFGYRPSSADASNPEAIAVRVDGRWLEFDRREGSHHVFRLPPSLAEINRVDIEARPFVPKKLGLNPDERRLGLDLKAISLR